MTALARLADLVADMTDGERSELAHRFRTPLALIVGYAELLQRRGDDASRERATLILEAAEELGDALNELLEGGATAPEETAPEASVAGPGERPIDSRGSRSVLIVEDDEAMRRLLSLTLADAGFDVVEAGGVAEADAAVARRAPDLLLLDWNVPDAPGAVVLAKLRREHPATRTIVLTADSREIARHAASLLGADLFLTKPFSRVQLLAAIERLLRRAA